MEWSIQLIVIMTMATRLLSNTNVPPYITCPFASEYYLTEGGSNTFHCAATGYPQPRFEWLKDGVKVQNSQHITVDEITGTLSIIDAQRQPVSDYGTYQCLASNKVGKAASVEFQLKRAYITKFQDLQPVELKDIHETDYVRIPCTGKPECQPLQDCKIEWKRGVGTASNIQESDRIAIDNEGTLHFLSVTKSDQSTYTEPIACGMNHEPSKAFFKGRNVIMTVLTGTPKQYKPHVIFNADAKGLLNGEVKLQCVFTGNPLPNIEWYRPDGTKISADNQKYTFKDEKTRRNLVIKYLTEEDEGMYRCDADNDVGKTQANLFLNVTSKPRFPPYGPRLENVVVPRGHDATFTCKMESLKGEQKPTAPAWSKNGEHLAEDQIGSGSSQKYQLSDDRTVLTIKNVQNPEDSCTVMCESGNVIIDDNLNDKFVKTYAGATLRVIEPVGITVLTATEIEISEPEPFSMALIASKDESVPALFLNWNFTMSDNTTFFNDNQLFKQPWVHFSPNKNNLTIVPEKYDTEDDDDKVRSVAGIYRVHIFHQYEDVYIEFNVTADIETIIITEPLVESAGFDLWIIGLILGLFVLLIIIFFIICTLYRNRGGEYPVDKKEVDAGHDPQQELKDGGLHDLSRADEKRPFDSVSLTDEKPLIDSDDDSAVEDYDDDDEMTKFNEDGSFIGKYMSKKDRGRHNIYDNDQSYV